MAGRSTVVVAQADPGCGLRLARVRAMFVAIYLALASKRQAIFFDL
jgi:hypothetical protein